MLYDVVVVGSGIAGLFSALYAKRAGNDVVIITKSNPFRSNSAVASGGINAVLNTNQYDSVRQHIQDTINGADGLTFEQNIIEMCQEAPAIIHELYKIGVAFDKDEQGNIKQRPFGGASKNRTCYIADRTGSAIVQGLLKQCRHEGVEILSNHQMLSITKFDDKLSGITLLHRADSHVTAFACKALILAGGGYAGIYRGHSTNPQESSGDVIAAALRAGMRLSNLEFVQFHPTTLKNGALISEAARGEGAYIVDETGERFTDELQTRDKLSRAILEHIAAGHKVYLDFRHLPSEIIETRLPSTQKMALNGAGIDIKTELLEISPSAHYSIGGIWTRGDTTTDLDGVFACGECAATGVHGANRLGGNSLLEAAYFGKCAGREASRWVKKQKFLPIDFALVNKDYQNVIKILDGENHFNINAMRKNLGESLFKNAGIYRSEATLSNAFEYVHYLMKRQYGLHCVNKERHNNVELSSILEFKNALLIAEAMVLSAMKREESRGVHYREDFPSHDDKMFRTPSYVRIIGDDFLKISFENNTVENLWFKIKSYFKKLQRRING
jgi:succinate dehydrogenase/fumarate reductase flavoprotein subunit